MASAGACLRANEELYFFFWDVAPTYDRTAIQEAATVAADEYGSAALCVYELFGTTQVLVRVWLPHGTTPTQFMATVEANLTVPCTISVKWFYAAMHMHHFAFVEPGTLRPRPPEQDDIFRFSDNDFERVERHFSGLEDASDLVTTFAGLRLVADLKKLQPPNSHAGHKFVTTVHAELGAASDSRRRLGIAVRDLLASQSTIYEWSVYRGGGQADYLVMGRVYPEKFEKLHADFVSQLNTEQFRLQFELSHTVTFICAQRGMRVAAEGLSSLKGDSRLAAAPNAALEASPPRSAVSAVRRGAGETVDERFELVRPLGQGGMAIVWLAYDKYDSSERAIKLFSSNDEAGAEREAAILRRLEHPNIVRFLTDGYHGDRPYIAMEYCSGNSLRQIIEDPLHSRDARAGVELVLEVLDGLRYLHPKDRDVELEQLQSVGQAGDMSNDDFNALMERLDWGFIHRDIKPENLVFSVTGRLKIVDFNIASPANAEGKTQRGTPGYTAPYFGLGGWAPQVDLYATGAVLYELLSGRLPLRIGDPPSEISRVWIPLDPSRVSGATAEFVAALDAVLEKACAFQKYNCYETAAEMAQALRDVLARHGG